MTSRRKFIHSLISTLPLSAGLLSACNESTSTSANAPTRTQADANNSGHNPLLPADKNGLMLPAGFTSRIIARSGATPSSTSPYVWHGAPDGGETFATQDNGWIYVSNSELNNNKGGVGAVRFDAQGNIIDAYSILKNTSRNCAGGATPWGSWLSCEEVNRGLIWECDPYGKIPATALPALGAFAHEAITLDTVNQHFYLTEDKHDGGLYRFIPTRFSTQLHIKGRADLNIGTLQIALFDSRTSTLSWQTITDPGALNSATRHQVPVSKKFNGGEGIVYRKHIISFATKGDNRIWALDTRSQRLSVVYDAQTHKNPILTGVDNMTLSPSGELVISEDGGNLQIIRITHQQELIPLLQLVGHDQSELTGPAFSPNGKHLYFSSQRGTTGQSKDGVTFEVTGEFI